MENRDLMVNNFSLDKAFLELTRIYQSEGAEQAGKDFLFIIKGVDENLDADSMLKRFYQLAEKVAMINPDDLSIMLKSGKILKEIYNSSGVVLNEAIDGIGSIVTESAYIVHFLQNDIVSIAKELNQECSLSDEVVFSGSVASVLLKTLYDEFLENKSMLDKHITRKENMGGVPLQDFRKEKMQILEEYFFQTLIKIKKQLFIDDYVGVVEDLKGFLNRVNSSGIEDIGTLALQIKDLRRELESKTFLKHEETIDADIAQSELQEKEAAHEVTLGGDSELLEEIEKMISGIIDDDIPSFATKKDMLKISTDIDGIKMFLSEIEDSISSALKNSKEAGSHSDIPSQNITSSNIDLSEISNKIDDLERVIMNIVDSDDVNEAAPGQHQSEDSNLESKIEEVKTAIAGISEEIEESRSATRNLHDSLAKKIEESSSSLSYARNDTQGYSADVDFSGLETSVLKIDERISVIESQNESLSRSITSVMEIVQTLAESINSEIEIAREFRKANGYEN